MSGKDLHPSSCAGLYIRLFSCRGGISAQLSSCKFRGDPRPSADQSNDFFISLSVMTLVRAMQRFAICCPAGCLDDELTPDVNFEVHVFFMLLLFTQWAYALRRAVLDGSMHRKHLNAQDAPSFALST